MNVLTIESLVKSPVRFDEEPHTYTLDGIELSGITSLIKGVLGLGIYEEASDFVKNDRIPRAGARGTAVHHAIQSYDELGIFDSMQLDDMWGEEVNEEGQRYWDVSNELRAYIKHLDGYIPVANEYTVSDEQNYASQIDNIWQHKETGDIWLVDTKTNNLDYYPLCGYFKSRYFRTREAALKEYLSWQLSVYAYLFEWQNPGLKVEGLACNWLRKDKSAFWIIDRKDDKLVEELLKSEKYQRATGEFVYWHPNPEVFGIESSVPETAEETLPVIPDDVVAYMTELNSKLKEYEAKMSEAKEALKKAMTEHNVYKAELGTMTATLSADSTSKTFDISRFKKDHPELYDAYIIEKERKGSLLLKFKD